jgi:hypothetical protein
LHCQHLADPLPISPISQGTGFLLLDDEMPWAACERINESLKEANNISM